MPRRLSIRWQLNGNALEQLLTRLDPSPERAAEQYEELRRTLLRFFEWRGAPAPEEGADEVLDRLARKCEQDHAILNVRAYAYGIARLVALEQARSPQARRVSLEAVRNREAAVEPGESPLLPCLERCLAELPMESRALILRYYAHENGTRIDGRRQFAQELGVRPEALRSRVQRLRARLEACAADCGRRSTLS